MRTNHTESPLLSHREAARYLRISGRTLQSIVRRGLIAAVRMSPGRIGYLLADLDLYIERSKAGDSENERA